MQGEQLECLPEVVPERGINRLRIVFGLELRLINPDQLFPFARVLPEAVVSDPVKPGGELRLPAKAADVLVGTQKSLLREVVREREVGACELTKQTAHGRLMIAHQLGEGMVVILE